MIPRVLFILGCPASGKGTVCCRLADTFPKIFSHLSAGDLLRRERDEGSSDTAKIIQDCMSGGRIVPVKITVGLLYAEITNLAKDKGSNRVFLIDGYPRNEDNVTGWNENVGDKLDVLGCLNFVCSFETMKNRILGRVQEAKANGLKVRVDDNEETIKKRFDQHNNETVPIIEDYRKEGKCWDVDAEQEKEAMFTQTIELVKGLVTDVEFE